MFTLSGLILEARENLFWNFWSPFSISFYFSSARNYFLKKTTAVPYIFEIVIFVLLFELALIVFLNYPFPVFPFR